MYSNETDRERQTELYIFINKYFYKIYNVTLIGTQYKNKFFLSKY